jgi:hypothetical protein
MGLNVVFSLEATGGPNRQLKQERTKEEATSWSRHTELLDKAAGVSTVNLVCHPEPGVVDVDRRTPRTASPASLTAAWALFSVARSPV